MGSSALRKGRWSEPERIYIVTTVTYGRRPVFLDFRAARTVVHALRFQQDAGRVRSLAWVVMPDHLHWLVQLPADADLVALMHSTKGFSARALVRQGFGMAPVWQHGFHDRGLRADEELESAARYIVANPVRAGLVKRVGDWPHWDAIYL